MAWYFGFFLVSGFCGLVYEIVWLRLAMAAFGVTTPFISIVVSVFMAGLAIGSWGTGRLAPRVMGSGAGTPLRLYGAAELLIGLSGVAVPHQLGWGRELLASGSGVAWDSLSYYLASGLLITLTLLPYCVCMGATFPLAMAAMRREFGAASERSFSYLYVANVIGATAGTLVAAFVFIELLGFQHTLYLAASLNALLAVCAFIRSPRRASGALERGVPAKSATAGPRVAPSWMALVLLFTTGLVSMAMELVWIRQFTMFLGTFVYTFAAILALYLVATFVGSQTYRALSSHVEGSLSIGAWPIAGLLALVPLITWHPWPPLPAIERVAVGIGPFCVLLGFLTPMLVDGYSGGDPARAGVAYGLNVLGSLIGPLLAGFLLLPYLGARWALVVLAAPLLAAGLIPALSARDAPGQRSQAALRLALVTAVAALIVVRTDGYDGWFGGGGEIRRDHTATVVATGTGMSKQLFVNGQGITSMTPITKMMAHLPAAALGQRPKDALTIALGMGTTFRSLLSWDVHAVAIELVPSVPALFPYFHPDAPALVSSAHARIVIDDGRRFLERSREDYDLIIIDPPPPPEAAASSLLYSREFYAIAKKRLRPGGIVQQWFPEGGDAAILASVARALDVSFPHVHAFSAVSGRGVHFLASMRPILFPSARVLADRVPPKAAADLLEWGPGSTVAEQFRLVLGREITMSSLLAAGQAAPVLSDDRPFNEYFFLRRPVPLIHRWLLGT